MNLTNKEKIEFLKHVLHPDCRAVDYASSAKVVELFPLVWDDWNTLRNSLEDGFRTPGSKGQMMLEDALNNAIFHYRTYKPYTPANVNITPSKGVSWDERRGKWRVAIKQSGKVKHLGYFSDLESANETALSNTFGSLILG